MSLKYEISVCVQVNDREREKEEMERRLEEQKMLVHQVFPPLFPFSFFVLFLTNYVFPWCETSPFCTTRTV